MSTKLDTSVYFFNPVKSKKAKHRGDVLQDVVATSGISITKLTEKVKFSRTTYYNHIMDPELSFDILQRYGKVLKHDFSADFPELKLNLLEEDNEDYVRPTTIDQAIKMADKWKAKYYALLEKYNQLLEEKLKK